MNYATWYRRCLWLGAGLALVVIALGANDALRGQPVAAARANLEEMIRLARAARAEPVLVGLMIPPNYGIDYAREFRELYPQLARKSRVALVPFLLDGIAEGTRLDLALAEAGAAMARGPRTPENHGTVILLTDGLEVEAVWGDGRRLA